MRAIHDHVGVADSDAPAVAAYPSDLAPCDDRGRVSYLRHTDPPAETIQGPPLAEKYATSGITHSQAKTLLHEFEVMRAIIEQAEQERGREFRRSLGAYRLGARMLGAHMGMAEAGDGWYWRRSFSVAPEVSNVDTQVTRYRAPPAQRCLLLVADWSTAEPKVSNSEYRPQSRTSALTCMARNLTREMGLVSPDQHASWTKASREMAANFMGSALERAGTVDPAALVWAPGREAHFHPQTRETAQFMLRLVGGSVRRAVHGFLEDLGTDTPGHGACYALLDGSLSADPIRES